jgi:hypothetical protein
MAQNHMRGASKMAELNGGQQTLGLDGFLELVFNKWVDEVGLSSKLQDRHPPGSCAKVFRDLAALKLE